MIFLQLRYLLICIFSVVFSVIASTSNGQPVEFGVIGGVNVSSHLNNFRYSVDDIDITLHPEVTMAYQAGLVIRKEMNSKIRWQAEPSFVLMGAQYEEAFTIRGFTMQTDSKTELAYIQLPVLLQFNTSQPPQIVYGLQNASTTLHLTGGIFGGYLLDARFSGTNTGAPLGIPFQSKFANDITSQYSEYDGGIILGAGFEHGLNKKVGLETRVQLSVLNSGDAPELSFKPHNTAISLAVYFLL